VPIYRVEINNGKTQLFSSDCDYHSI